MYGVAKPYSCKLSSIDLFFFCNQIIQVCLIMRVTKFDCFYLLFIMFLWSDYSWYFICDESLKKNPNKSTRVIGRMVFHVGGSCPFLNFDTTFTLLPLAVTSKNTFFPSHPPSPPRDIPLLLSNMSPPWEGLWHHPQSSSSSIFGSFVYLKKRLRVWTALLWLHVQTQWQVFDDMWRAEGMATNMHALINCFFYRTSKKPFDTDCFFCLRGDLTVNISVGPTSCEILCKKEQLGVIKAWNEFQICVFGKRAVALALEEVTRRVTWWDLLIAEAWFYF